VHLSGPSTTLRDVRRVDMKPQDRTPCRSPGRRTDHLLASDSASNQVVPAEVDRVITFTQVRVSSMLYVGAKRQLARWSVPVRQRARHTIANPCWSRTCWASCPTPRWRACQTSSHCRTPKAATQLVRHVVLQQRPQRHDIRGRVDRKSRWLGEFGKRGSAELR